MSAPHLKFGFPSYIPGISGGTARGKMGKKDNAHKSPQNRKEKKYIQNVFSIKCAPRWGRRLHYYSICYLAVYSAFNSAFSNSIHVIAKQLWNSLFHNRIHLAALQHMELILSSQLGQKSWRNLALKWRNIFKNLQIHKFSLWCSHVPSEDFWAFRVLFFFTFLLEELETYYGQKGMRFVSC